MDFPTLYMLAAKTPEGMWTAEAVYATWAGYPFMVIAMGFVWRFMVGIRTENGERFTSLDDRNQDLHEAYEKKIETIAAERKLELKEGTLALERNAVQNEALVAQVKRLVEAR